MVIRSSWVGVLFLCLLQIAFAGKCFANLPDGYGWLSGQQQVNGSFATALSESQQATFESLVALQQQNTVTFNQGNAVSHVLASTDADAETLSRRLILAVQNNTPYQTLLAQLVSYQNSDGGFGSYPGHDSTALETAYAILAMQNTSTPPTKMATAVSYLVNHQKSDGSFLMTTDGNVSFYATALASLALESQRFNYSLSTQIQKANGVLLSTLTQNLSSLSSWEKAYGLLALSTVSTDAAPYQFINTDLLASQLVNGSWENDAYVTALVLQAAHSVASQNNNSGSGDTGGTGGGTTTPPSIASTITGVVIDNVTSQPVGGASLSLSGANNTTLTANALGQFSFDNLASGNYSLSISSAGYSGRTIAIDLASSTSLGLGTIPLTQIPTQGIIKGFVKDGSTNTPLTAATLSFTGAINTTATTDTSGFYQVSGAAGSFNVTVSKANYVSASTSGPVIAGGITNFSPVLYPVASPVTPTTEVAVSGFVFDNTTQTPIAGASIVEQTSGATAQTNSNGAFSFTNLAAGNLVLHISKAGYVDISASLLASAGNNISVGTIYLSPVDPPLTSIMKGVVSDYTSHAPIAGASVIIDGKGLSATTDASGAYTINNIPNAPFTVTVTAAGYVSTHGSANIQSASLVTGNYTLVPLNYSSVSIVELATDKSSFPAFNDIDIDVRLLNSGTQDDSVRLMVTILDANGTFYAQFPAMEVPKNLDPEVAFIKLLPNVEVTSEAEWHVGNAPPGDYEIVIQAINHEQQLLAEKSIYVAILPTTAIGGSVSFNPPITTLSDNSPVTLQANINNAGNEAIPAGSVTATVSLKNRGTDYQDAVTLSAVNKTDFSESGPTGMDAAGNLYVVQPNAKTLKKISPSGVVETVATNLPASVIDLIVDVDHSGLFYLLTSQKYYTLSAIGNVLQTYSVGSHFPLSKFTLTPDRRLFIAMSDGVFQANLDGTTVDLVGTGLANASGMVQDSNGVIYISDEGSNAIWKFTNGVISSYVTNITKPSAIIIDNRDYLYVTSFDKNTLVEISPQRVQRVVTNQLSGPKDVKKTSGGDFVVLNYNSNQLVKVTDTGVITQLVGPSLNRPYAAASDHQGGVMVGNLDGTLVSVAPDLQTTPIASGLVNIIDLYVQGDGSSVVLNKNGSHIDVVGASGVITPVANIPRANSIVANPSGGYLVASNGSGGISQVSTSGAISTYLPDYLTLAKRIGSDAAGNLYVLTYWGQIIKINSTTQVMTPVIANVGFTLSSYPGFAVASDGTIYLSDYQGKKIIKVNPNATVQTLATLAFNPGPLSIGPNGSVLIGQPSSAFIYQMDTAGSVSLYRTLSAGQVYASMQYNAATNELWVGGSQFVDFVTADGVEHILNPTNGSGINDLVLLADGSVLVSASGKMVRVSRAMVFSNAVDPALLGNLDVVSTALDANGNYWALRSSSRLDKFNVDGTLANRFATPVSPSHMVWGLDNKLYVSDGNFVLRINAAATLAELVGISSGLDYVIPKTANTLLITNGQSVMQLDVTSGAVTTLATGFNSITSLIWTGNAVAVLDDGQSRYVELSPVDGSVIRQFSGLVAPTAVAIDAGGSLYVANGSQYGAILKQNASGLLERWMPMNFIINMRFLANQDLLVSSGNQTQEFTPAAVQVNSYNYTWATDMLTQSDGTQIMLNKIQLLKNTSSGFVTLASGVSDINGIDSDSSNHLYVVDSARDALLSIGSDGSLTLMRTLNTPRGLKIQRGQNIFMAFYSNNQVMIFDQEGRQVDFDGSAVGLNAISSMSWRSPTLAYWMSLQHAIYRADVVIGNNGGIQPGDIVYTTTQALPALYADGSPVLVDLGQWQPQQDGDYLVRLTADDTSISGALMNTLHVGSSGHGSIGLSQTQSLPGNVTVGSGIRITGAASNTLTHLATNAVTKLVTSPSSLGSLAADSLGNVYMAGSRKIIKFSTSGVPSTFVDNILINPSIAMAVDDHDNLYAVSFLSSGVGWTVYKIDPQGHYTSFASFPSNQNVSSLAASFDGKIYVNAGSSIYIYNSDGTRTKLPEVGVNGYPGQDMAIGPDGTIYLRQGNDVVRVSADGSSERVLREGAAFAFENEGVSLAADCAGNVLVAPFNFPPFDTKIHEEDTIYQILPDTGEAQVAFYGPSVDAQIIDMDSIYFDRFGSRLLVMNHGNGNVYSIPAICGGIDTQVVVTTRSDVELSSVDPQPASTINNSDGSKQVTWDLKNVDSKGFTISANWLFKNMVEGETRPVVSDAYMQINNSFAPANPARVPISISALTASRQASLDMSTDQNSYGSNTDVQISVTVTNASSVSFNGSVDMVVVSSAGGLITTLPAVPVSQLAGNSSITVSSTWNTGANFTGDYRVQAELMDAGQGAVANADSQFAIVLDDNISTAIDSHIGTDKILYTSGEAVTLNGRVMNLSNNAIVAPTVAQLTVTAPDGAVVFTNTTPVDSLYPNGIYDLHHSLSLAGNALGLYHVALVVRDAQSGVEMSSRNYTFTVTQGGLGGSGLSGIVAVNIAQAIKGQDVVCTETIRNQSAVDYDALPLRQLLMNMDGNVEVNQLPFSLDVASNAEQQVSHTISTQGLNAASYACLLQAQINGVWETLGGAGFDVTLPPLNLVTTLHSDKAQYQTTDNVQLLFAVNNLSALATQSPIQATVTVTTPNGLVIYTQTFAVSALNGNATLNDQRSFALTDAAAGTYHASITLVNADTNQSVVSDSITFAVVDAPLTHITGSVSASAAQVNRGESLNCTDTVTNTSQVSSATANIERRLVQVTTGGEVMVDSNSSLTTLIPVQQSVSTRTVDSHTLVAGNYACQLYASVNGETIKLGQAAFTVKSAVLKLSATISSDKAEYQADDTVVLSDKVSNLSDLATEQAVTVNVQVKDPNVVVIFDQNTSIAQLAANADQVNQWNVTLTHAAAGNYTVTLRVLDATQVVVTTANATFVVVDDPIKHLSGTVVSSATQIKKGEALTCSYKLVNSSLTSTITATIERRLVLVDAQAPSGFTVITGNNVAKTLLPNVTDTNAEGIDTVNLAEGQYRCEQFTQVDHEIIALGSAEFKVVDANVDLDTTYALGDKGRLLILLDAIAQTNGEETALRNLLDEGQWSYTIVYTAESFATQLATGQYMAYGLLASEVTLPLQTQQALAADINAGKGLLISGGVGACDPTLEAVLGIQLSNGENSDEHDGEHHDTHDSAHIVFPAGALGADWPATTIEQTVNQNVDLVTASAIAYLTGYRHSDHQGQGYGEHRDDAQQCPVGEQEPAVTINQYGLGVAMYIDFDVVAQAGNGSSTYVRLLKYGLEAVHPEPMPVSAPYAVPVNITVQNNGIATQIRLRLSDTANAHFVAGNGWSQVQDAGQTYWQYSGSLDESSAFTTTVYLQLLNNNAVAVPLNVATSLDGNQWAVFSEDDIKITPVTPPTPPVQAPVAESNDCECSNGDTHSHQRGNGHGEHGNGWGWGHCKDHEDHDEHGHGNDDNHHEDEGHHGDDHGKDSHGKDNKGGKH